jgi:hypothetical protein
MKRRTSLLIDAPIGERPETDAYQHTPGYARKIEPEALLNGRHDGEQPFTRSKE